MASPPAVAFDASEPTPRPSTLRDPWAWLAVLSVLPLLFKSLGAPLGEPVAEDFDFLRRSILAPANPLLDGGGSSAFWRPVAHQLYYDVFGRLMLEHPGAIAAIHISLLALSALLLYRVFRRGFSGPLAAAIAAFPFMAESTRTLITWPSHFVDLGAFLFSVLALHEAAHRRMVTALTSLLAALLCKEVAAVTAVLLPFMPGLATSRNDRVRWLAGAGLVLIAWAATYSWVRQHAGLELPHGLERDASLLHVSLPSRLMWAFVNSKRAIFGLARLPARTDAWVIAPLIWIVLVSALLFVRNAEARRRLRSNARWALWGLAWFALGAGSLATIYPLWSPNRSQYASLGYGVAAITVTASAHPALAGALVLTRLVALLAAPGAPRTVSPEAPEHGAFIDFPRVTRLQRLMRDTRHALQGAYPTLPHGAAIAFRNLPLTSEYAFGGARAVQAWYRDTTLAWVSVSAFERDVRQPLMAMIDYQPPPHTTVALLDPEALRAFKSGSEALRAGRVDEALAALDAADHAQRDRTAAILLGEIAGRRAGALLTQRRFPEAETQARAALAASRLDVGAWYALAIARAAQGDRAGARAAADSLLAVRPSDPDGLQLKAALGQVPAR